MIENDSKLAMIPATQAVEKLQGLGFERVQLIDGNTYQDNSTIIIIPTRGMMHHKFVSSLQSLIAPMNQKRAILFAAGDEVGVAYNRMIENILNDPEISKWKYIMTIEDDNLVPPDAHIRLLESINSYNFDAVSGLYWTKGDFNMPMAYGDPAEFTRTGILDFKPRDVRQALQNGNLMEVNGIAQGISLYRMSLFKEIKAPWFVTVADVIPDKGVVCMTQDLNFCEKARRVGKRFAVDMRVKTGHLDINTNIVY